jgi:hypothetical protein
MNNIAHSDAPTHAARFARALALGFTAGSLLVAACSSGTTNSETASTTTTTDSVSSGSEGSVGSSDAGASLERVTAGSPCTPPQDGPDTPRLLRGMRPNADPNAAPGSMCFCNTEADAGGSTWSCVAAVTGPLPPPELA